MVSTDIEMRSGQEINEQDEPTFANINGLLINPFQGKSREEMDQLINQFMVDTQIDGLWIESIRKGAYLAQDPDSFAEPRDDGLALRPEEQYALKLEDPKAGNKWDQRWILYALVICCSIGAAVQGMDEAS